MKFFVVLAVMALASNVAAQKIPVILDTDIGDDVDDAYALLFAAHCSELEILGVTTVHGNTVARAQLAQKLLKQRGKNIPVFAGETGQGNPRELADQLKTLTPEERSSEVQRSAVDFIVQTVNSRPGEVVLLPYGPQTNIAAALKKDPTLKNRVKRIVAMGGQVYSARTGRLPADRAEYNIKSDVAAAQTVFSSGAPLTMVGLDVTLQLDLPEGYIQRLENSGNTAYQELVRLTKIWGRDRTILHDPLAVAAAFDPSLVLLEPLHIEVDHQGYTRLVEGKPPNVEVATWVNRHRFLALLMSRLLGPR